MCTAIRYKDTFGRTFDYEKSFGEQLVKLEKGSDMRFVHEGYIKAEHSVIGAAKVFDDKLLFFDGMNEVGLCAAALNFPRYAFYRGSRCDGINLASFEVIGYILALCSSVEEVKYRLRRLNITPISVSEELCATPLHWMISDRRESVVIEPLRCGVRILDNPVEVLTNSPPLEYQLTRLSDFLHLDSLPSKNRLCADTSVTPYSRGMGAIGLPGDWSSSSRFARAVFVKEKLYAGSLGKYEAFLEIAKSISVPKGCVMSESGEAVGTLYTSFMDMSDGVYRYRKTGDFTEKCLSF